MHNVFGTNLPPAINPAHRWRVLVLRTGIAGYLLTRLPLLATLNATASWLGWQKGPFILVHVLFLAGIVVAYIGTRQQNLKPAGVILVSVLLAESALYLVLGEWTSPRGWGTLLASMALSHLLLDQRQSRITVLAALAIIVTGALHDVAIESRGERIGVMLAMLIWTLSLAVIARIASWGNQFAIKTLLQNLSTRHLIEVGQRVAASVSAREELDTALQAIADDLEQRFPTVHHVQIYLIEQDSDNAVLTAATGPVGKQLLTQEHRLGVGGLSPVGRATLTRKHLLIADFSRETIHTPTELLTDMRSELVIPLQTAGRVTGALDLQSRQIEAFTQADVTLLSAIAEQIAVAIDALQLYAQSQRSLRENRALYEQTQMNLREIERLNYQLTGRAWSDYLRHKADITALTLDLESGETTAEAAWTPTLNEAAQHRQVITVTKEGQRIVALPIIVRNEVVGAMEFELPHTEGLPEGAREMVMAVGQRLGLALENRRLFDETQRVAQREGLINDIGAELQAATNVDVIIQRTARHLQETLSAQEVTIRLSPRGVDQH